MKKFLILFSVILFVLFAQGLVSAQPQGRREWGEGPEIRKERGEGHQRGAKMVETLRIWKMVDSLNLSEEQLAKFLPKLKEEKELRREYGEERKRNLENLRELLIEEEVSEKEIKAQLKELEEIDSEFQEETKALREEVKKLLNTRQQAQFYIANEEFQKELRHLLGGMKRMRGRERGPHGPGERMQERKERHHRE
jgi:Spy/CpxP family protein refolding chaperone